MVVAENGHLVGWLAVDLQVCLKRVPSLPFCKHEAPDVDARMLHDSLARSRVVQSALPRGRAGHRGWASLPRRRGTELIVWLSYKDLSDGGGGAGQASPCTPGETAREVPGREVQLAEISGLLVRVALKGRCAGRVPVDVDLRGWGRSTSCAGRTAHHLGLATGFVTAGNGVGS